MANVVAVGDGALARQAHALDVLWVHRGQEPVVFERAQAAVAAEDAPGLLGGADTVLAHVPLPVAHLADALRVRQAALVLLQLVDRRAGAQHVAHAVREDRPVDRLGDEVGGADLEGALDRLHVVQAGHHHHRHALAAGQLAQLGAGR